MIPASEQSLPEEIRTLLVEADSALSLIFYRFGSRLVDIQDGQFKDDVGRLIMKLRNAYERRK